MIGELERFRVMGGENDNYVEKGFDFKVYFVVRGRVFEGFVCVWGGGE